MGVAWPGRKGSDCFVGGDPLSEEKARREWFLLVSPRMCLKTPELGVLAPASQKLARARSWSFSAHGASANPLVAGPRSGRGQMGAPSSPNSTLNQQWGRQCPPLSARSGPGASRYIFSYIPCYPNPLALRSPRTKWRQIRREARVPVLRPPASLAQTG